MEAHHTYILVPGIHLVTASQILEVHVAGIYDPLAAKISPSSGYVVYGGGDILLYGDGAPC